MAWVFVGEWRKTEGKTHCRREDCYFGGYSSVQDCADTGLPPAAESHLDIVLLSDCLRPDCRHLRYRKLTTRANSHTRCCAWHWQRLLLNPQMHVPYSCDTTRGEISRLSNSRDLQPRSIVRRKKQWCKHKFHRFCSEFISILEKGSFKPCLKSREAVWTSFSLWDWMFSSFSHILQVKTLL